LELPPKLVGAGPRDDGEHPVGEDLREGPHAGTPDRERRPAALERRGDCGACWAPEDGPAGSFAPARTLGGLVEEHRLAGRQPEQNDVGIDRKLAEPAVDDSAPRLPDLGAPRNLVRG